MKRIIIYLISSCLLVWAAACKPITDINVDPNKMPYGNATPESLLQDLIMESSKSLLTRAYVFSGDMIQHTVCTSSDIHYNRYYISDAAVTNTWNAFYRWAADAEHLRKLSVKKENKGCEAIAIIMKVLLMQYTTDMFGDIPYSKAFLSDEGNKTPVYDSQEDVYCSMIGELSHANDLLSSADVEISDGGRDLLYGGDMEKWRRFGNSLLLRCYLRLSNRNDVFNVSGKINDIYSDDLTWPVFDEVEDSAILFYDDVAPFVNSYGNNLTIDESYRASEFMIEMMTTDSDPRISMYYRKNGSLWKGAPSGEEGQETTWGGVAYTNKETLFNFSSPFSLMRYDEVLFIFAEAAQKGWIVADAADLYKRAVSASVDYWELVSGRTVSQKDMEAFLTKIQYDGTLRQLMSQKYIALFGLGFNAWSEQRRTGYPKLPIGSGTFNDHMTPTRFAYPQSEYHNNPDSYDAAVSRLATFYKGGDNMKTPVWWSQLAITNGIK